MPSPAPAAHFSPEALNFLRGLARHNDRDWFEARRSLYETSLKAPLLALIEEINSSMQEFAPDHLRPAHKIAMRIYRDIRFSSDKRPYKSHLAAWWSRRGMEKTSGAGFYLQISPTEVLLAAGVYMPAPDQLLALRRWMAVNHAAYSASIESLLHPAPARPRSKAAAPAYPLAFQPIDPQALARSPRGFAPDHPAADLLRARNWGVRSSLPPGLALSPGLASEIVRRFHLAAPLVATLNAAILSQVPS